MRQAPEDNVDAGRRAIEAALRGCGRALYIGITCGFSAPYVAAQLDYCIGRAGTTAVLLGFNPIDRARRVPIEGWDRTFADVAAAMVAADNCIFLNPVVGPECHTGSTRMKGGSATKLLLEAIFALALGAEGGSRVQPEAVRPVLLEYAAAVRGAYAEPAALAAGVEAAGAALRAGGRLLYLGEGTPGVCSLVDASECPPTYNATAEDVRAFVRGGYEVLGNDDGDLAPLGRPAAAPPRGPAQRDRRRRRPTVSS